MEPLRRMTALERPGFNDFARVQTFLLQKIINRIGEVFQGYNARLGSLRVGAHAQIHIAQLATQLGTHDGLKHDRDGLQHVDRGLWLARCRGNGLERKESHVTARRRLVDFLDSNLAA
ncbi:hypothetical protein HYQ46_000841 [Verticillium longisporum]|nr:hypothetical protein HYQ46_000841 [Verticillium longisporum]